MTSGGQRIRLGEWLLEPQSGQLSRNGEQVFLDHTPLQLLLCLIAHPGEDLTKEVLLEHGWKGKIVGEEVLTVAVSQIRKQIGDNARRPKYIKTIPGVGYRLLILPEYVTAEPKTSHFGRKKINVAIPLLIVFSVVLLLSLFSADVTLRSSSVVTLSSLPQATQDKFRKSRFLATQETPEAQAEAQTLLQQIITNSPGFALAYLELVKVKLIQTSYETRLSDHQLKALYVLLQKAIEHDPNLADAYFLFGRLAFLQEMNIAKAKDYLLDALERNTDHSPSHRMLAQLYLATGEFELAIHHTGQYVDLSPEAYEIPTVAWIYNMMGHYQQALEELSKLETLRPDSWVYSVSAQSILENMDRQEESFIAMQDVFKHAGFSQQEQDIAIGYFNNGGLKAVYQWLLHEQREIRNIGQYSPPLAYARFAAKSGNMQLARQYLKQAFEKRQVQLLWLNVDPKYHALRNTPEFEHIVSTLGLHNPM